MTGDVRAETGRPGSGGSLKNGEEMSKPGEPATADEHQAEWADLVGAVAGAAFRVDEMATEGFGSAPGSAAAASILDAAIRAIEVRRRSPTNVAPDVPLDSTVLHPQVLRDLLEFLQVSRRGLYTAGEMAQEAGMWRQIVDTAWPAEARDASTVRRAVDLLAAVPAERQARPKPIPVEPVNELERAMAAVVADESCRPALWRALHDGDVVLPVVAYELIRPEGANFQFMAIPYGETPLVLGFATAERFDSQLPPGSQVSRVLAPGRDLSKFWPAGHWLMINPGYANSVVLSPWEITGLPHGGRSELPHPRAVQLAAPEEDDERAEPLVDMVTSLPAVDQVWWARVRPRRSPAQAPWQDVLIVSAPTGPSEADETAAAHALSVALPPGAFPRAIVIGRQADAEHPFIEAALTTARRIRT